MLTRLRAHQWAYWLLSGSLFVVSESSAQAQLIFALDVIRHGARTPLIELPTSNYHWSEGLGQLTARGMVQEYDLGGSLRAQYLKQHLLPKHYQAGSLLAYSTDWDRTLMSAQSFLQGLYPPPTGPLPNGFQPIPIHIFSQAKPSSADKNALIGNQVWQEKQVQYATRLSQWSALTNLPLKTIEDAVSLGDALFINQYHHIENPKQLTDSDAEEIIQLGTWVWVNFYHNYLMAHRVGDDSLDKISHWLEESTAANQPLKYVLWSGHDTTIAALLTLLDIPWDKIPPYASDLNFSVYANTPSPPFIKITYNNEPVKLSNCSSDPCTLKDFIDLTRQVLK